MRFKVSHLRLKPQTVHCYERRVQEFFNLNEARRLERDLREMERDFPRIFKDVKLERSK